MTALAARSITAPAPILPRVGIVAVPLPADREPMQWAWVETDTLIVGYDPARLTRSIVKLLLDDRLGDYVDIDEETAR